MSITSPTAYWAGTEAANANFIDAMNSNAEALTQHGSVGSTTGFISGEGARTFSASGNKYAERASDSVMRAGGNALYTFGGWFYAPNLASVASSRFILAKDIDSPISSRDYGLDLFNSAGTGFLRFQISGGTGGFITSANSVSTSTWHRFLCWHDTASGGTVNVQLDNNTPESSVDLGVYHDSTSSPFRIGARAYSGSEKYWEGNLQSIAYWKGYLLTSAERLEHWNSGAGLALASWNTTPALIGALAQRNALFGRRES